MLGIELGSLEKDRKVGYLFSERADFLLSDKMKYRDILMGFALIQIDRFKWEYCKVVAEPEFIFLKKGLEKYNSKDAYKTLYLIHNFLTPTLLEPFCSAALILII